MMTLDDKFKQAAEQLVAAKEAFNIIDKEQLVRDRVGRIDQVVRYQKAKTLLEHAQTCMDEVCSEYLLELRKS